MIILFLYYHNVILFLSIIAIDETIVKCSIIIRVEIISNAMLYIIAVANYITYQVYAVC